MSIHTQPEAHQIVSPLPEQRRRYRSLFLSDLHLGANGCRADRFLQFLNRHDAEVIYLVGDIFDNWQPISPKWSPTHDAVIQTLLARVREGVRIVYVPGNHDDFFRRHYGTYFGAIEVVEQAAHVAADGQRYLVVHGDHWDAKLFQARWLSKFGAWADSLVRGLNNAINRVRRKLELEEARMIEAALVQVNALLRYRNRFEERLTDVARQLGFDGVICGHFHKADLHDDYGVIYANCGDWVENFTALAEDACGRLRLLTWEGKPLAQAAPGPVAVLDDAASVVA